MSRKVDEAEERARWFSGDRFLASSDYEHTDYDCLRSIYCREYWCERHDSGKYYNELVETVNCRSGQCTPTGHGKIAT